METKVYALTGNPEEDREAISLAGQVIRSGQLAAIPTETVYGLAGDALNPGSASRIYEAKGRPSDNPLIVHIAEIQALEKIARDISPKALELARRFWPGPLTMIFPKKDVVPLETTGGLDTVAVRMPAHEAALGVIRAAGGYVAAPSANRSGRPSCTTAEHVLEDLNGKIGLILDGGPVGIGLESTIVDLTGRLPCLLRPGFISLKQLEEVLGEVETDPAVKGQLAPEQRPKAPGMKYRHYAPRGRLTVVSGTPEAVAGLVNRLTEEALSRGENPAVLASSETAGLYRCKNVLEVGSRARESEIAHSLFAMLRRADELEADPIFAEEFDTPQLGGAVMNRLMKAAGFHRIKASE
ncbi:MAG: threonylcarbamoyl-AMP synthase [Lachnospiraceae bacterium]|nr:threonylcarbamoyl-AMP synthase [Lachnospiraceae bacterium]